jgi:hypothetical protein
MCMIIGTAYILPHDALRIQLADFNPTKSYEQQFDAASGPNLRTDSSLGDGSFAERRTKADGG